MVNFIIENGILKSYEGNERVVVVPDGVVKVGGNIPEDESATAIKGDSHGYKAFFNNQVLEELYLPDSVEIFGFKCLEHCNNLKILSFSNNVKEFEYNALVDCNNLKRIIFRGTVFEFSLLSLAGRLDLNEVICTDGVIRFHQEYYIDILYFPGTEEEWNQFTKEQWLKNRARKVVFMDHS